MPIDVTHGGAVLAGLISFLSPCVLPLVPPYLCYMAGISLAELTGADDGGDQLAVRRHVMLSAASFVLGFSTIFIALGAAASAFGQFVRGLFAYQLVIPFIVVEGRPVSLSFIGFVAGLVVIAMGLHFLGVFRIAFLDREARMEVRNQPAGPLGSYVLGLAFAFGWTPCIGPVLAAILAVAGSEETVGRGAGLLAAYSLGLGVPFLAASLFAGPFVRFMGRFRAYLGAVEKTMGGLLIATGVLFITGGMATMSYWLLETFPALGRIG